jgi:hypothetical protein
MNYSAFLKRKAIVAEPAGLDIPEGEMNELLFPFQRKIVRWALRRGRAALWEDCGLGKTFQQLEWAKHICVKGDVLILAPLAVAHQTKSEGAKFGYVVNVCRTQSDARSGINITNYEMLEHFDGSQFVGVVLDESSILKAFDGKTRNQIVETFRNTPYKLACTATPAPNDYVEIGNHAEFLGIMSQSEMLSTFFIHDAGETQKWRLKGHAEQAFWAWLCSWAVNIRKPSDIGFSDVGYDLPPLLMHERIVETEAKPDGYLFAMEARTLAERREARKVSMSDRVKIAAEIAAGIPEQKIVWCDLNAESEALTSALPGAVEIRGSDSTEKKIETFRAFQAGEILTLVTKPSIAGLGLNWSQCSHAFYVGLSDSWEMFYQSLRRLYRFGQTKPVNAHLIVSQLEGAVLRNIQRKETEARKLQDSMVSHMQRLMYSEITATARETISYSPKIMLNIPEFL